MDESSRLKALQELAILDSEAEESFDRIVSLAATICGTPISAISLVDENRQWFKAKVGLALSETPRDISFCTHVVASAEMMVVENATQDPRFAENPLVASGPGIRFYAGAPLTGSEGLPYGALCVIDTQPRQLTSRQLEALQDLSRQAVRLMEYRRELRERRHRHVQAEEAHLFLRKFFRQAPLLMGITEVRGREIIHLSCNEATERHFERAHVAPERIMAESVGVDPGQLELWLQAYEASRMAGAPISFSFHETAGSGRRTIEVIVYHIGESAAGHPQYSYVGRDITRQIELGRTIAHQQAAILENAKLSSIGEMASGIAHEINNPLTIIHGNLTLMSDRVRSGSLPPDELARRLDKLIGTCERIAKIIASLRTVARQGDEDPLVPTSARAVVEEALELCRERFRHHGVELRIRATELRIDCRPVQISQILLNLLGNAFDAVVGQSGAWVEVSVCNGPDGSVRILVTDSGKGIPEPLRAKIMNPFFTTKPVGKGTGLGLSISRGLAESNHGTLSYDESSPHTRFILELPATAHPVRTAA